MAREIKFRAWDKDRHIMDYTDKDLRVDISDGALYIVNSRHDLEQYAIMQYTGLHDKSGKEIYEGDILLMDYGRGVKHIATCEWNVDTAGFVLRTGDGFCTASTSVQAKRDEVIGNIWENAELTGVTR